MNSRSFIVFVAGLLLVLPFYAQAQVSPSPIINPSSAVSPIATLAPSSELTVTNPTDFHHFARFIFLAELRRAFSTNPTTQLQETEAIVNRLWFDLNQSAQAGDVSGQNSIMTSLTRENGALSQELNDLVNTKPTNPAISDALHDEAVRLASVPTESDGLSTTLVRQINDIKTVSNHDIATTVTDPNLASNDRSQEVDTVVSAFAQKEKNVPDNTAQKLAMVGTIKTDSEDGDTTEVETKEQNLVDDATKLTESQITELTTSLKQIDSTEHGLVILQELQTKIPTLQNAISAVTSELLAKEAQKLAEDPQSVTELMDAGHGLDVRNDILNKLTDQIKDNGKLKDQIDAKVKKETEHDQKQQEKTDAPEIKSSPEEHSNEKKETPEPKQKPKENNNASNQGDAHTSSQTNTASHSDSNNSNTDGSHNSTNSDNTDNNSGSSATVTATATPEPTDTPEVKSETIQIKVKSDGTLDNMGYSVDKNSSLTIEFEDDHSVSHTLTLSNGQTITATPDHKVTLASFTISGQVTFTVSGVSGSGTITTK